MTASVVNLARAMRARPVRFLLPDGSEIVVPAPSVDQAIACLHLDPPTNGSSEAPLAQLERVCRQARILLGPEHAALTGVLDQWQLAEMAGALYVSASGLDAEMYARWQMTQREAKTRLSALEMAERLEEMTAQIAAELRRLPAEVGAQPLADILSLREHLAKERRAAMKFEAAVHDKKLS